MANGIGGDAGVNQWDERMGCDVRIRQIKNGWMAYYPTLPLAGAGKTETAAIASLERIISAHEIGLRRAGIEC